VEYLLEAAIASSGAELALLAVAPLPVCGNGVCEIGERPVANSSAGIGSAGTIASTSCHEFAWSTTLFLTFSFFI
jgi:hypothetical protein